MRLFYFALLLFVLPTLQAEAQTQGYTLNDDLIYRINFGSAEDVRLLLEKGANPNARTQQGETALEIVIARDDKESAPMADALIAKGVDINSKDKNGESLIVVAIKYKQTQIAKELLLKGAKYNINTLAGFPLIDFARQSGNLEIVKVIQGFMDRDNASAESFRTPARFKEIARQYVQDSCSYQYWNFFLTSRQASERDDDTKKKIADLKVTLTDLITQIETYYTSESMLAMKKVSDAAVGQIFNELDGMISNSNRVEQGVGSEKDEKERCSKVIEGLNLDIIPVGILTTPNIVRAAPTKPETK